MNSSAVVVVVGLLSIIAGLVLQEIGQGQGLVILGMGAVLVLLGLFGTFTDWFLREQSGDEQRHEGEGDGEKQMAPLAGEEGQKREGGRKPPQREKAPYS